MSDGHLRRESMAAVEGNLTEHQTLQTAETWCQGTFLRKHNRFVAVIDLGGREEHVHLPTSGRMTELLLPGTPVLLADRGREGRATRYDLIMAWAGTTLVSVDSLVPNRLLDQVFRNEALPEFSGWHYTRREVPLGESRIDFLLERGATPCWVEVKSVTLVRNGLALFPDAPTLRGVRHLGELASACEAGDRAAVVFIIQRDDAPLFMPNRQLDPLFAGVLADAARRGVEVYAYRCHVEPGVITLGQRVEVVLHEPDM